MNDSTAHMFDVAMGRARTQSFMRRQSTKIAEETVLSKHQSAVSIVTSINQFISQQIGGYVRSQSQMITIETYPMKWQVKRLDSDFETLREHLLKQFPQTIVPPLPAITKKKLTPNQTNKRKVYYQRFLNCALKSQVLKTSKFLVAFLQETN